MKTTFDLPDVLVQQVKRRAISEGRNLDATVVDLLHKGLATPETSATALIPAGLPRIGKHAQTRLPVILCNPGAPASDMTAAELIDLEQETQLQEDLERLVLA